MAKKKSHIATVYFVTIFVTILLVGGVAYLVVYNLFLKETEPTDGNTGTQVSDSELFVPTQEHNQTLLLILDAGSDYYDRFFVLARFLPTESKLILVPLPNDIVSQVGTTRNTLVEYYRTGGTNSAISAVQSATGVTVDRYIRIGKENSSLMFNMFGTVDFNVPYDLIYDNKTTGEATIIKSGERALNASEVRKMITYPNYDGGEDYRIKISGSLICEMINNSLNNNIEDSLTDDFNLVVNSFDTNITRFDFDLRKQAMEYVIQPYATPAQFKIPFCETNTAGEKVLSPTFVTLVQDSFDLPEEPGAGSVQTSMASVTLPPLE